jgi:hypothetical protein
VIGINSILHETGLCSERFWLLERIHLGGIGRVRVPIEASRAPETTEPSQAFFSKIFNFSEICAADNFAEVLPVGT